MNAVKALKSALPTSRHAEMLLDAVTTGLGALVHVETAGEGSRALAGSRTRDAMGTRQICSVGKDDIEPPPEGPPRKDLEVVRVTALWR